MYYDVHVHGSCKFHCTLCTCRISSNYSAPTFVNTKSYSDVGIQCDLFDGTVEKQFHVTNAGSDEIIITNETADVHTESESVL